MSAENAKRDWSKVHRRSARQVLVRLTPDEEAELTARAAEAQTTVAHLLKTSGLARPVTRRVRRPATADVELLRAIHADLGRLAGNSYQIVRGLNFGRNVPELEAVATLKEIRSVLVALRGEIFTALEREP